ncbi:hypothetical protein HYV74_03905 [Candidatus Uhrbacteria bacterium]|nr:hypothetical protein [Candidatus Uhrbacteria bacterium]
MSPSHLPRPLAEIREQYVAKQYEELAERLRCGDPRHWIAQQQSMDQPDDGSAAWRMLIAGALGIPIFDGRMRTRLLLEAATPVASVLAAIAERTDTSELSMALLEQYGELLGDMDRQQVDLFVGTHGAIVWAKDRERPPYTIRPAVGGIARFAMSDELVFDVLLREWCGHGPRWREARAALGAAFVNVLHAWDEMHGKRFDRAVAVASDGAYLLTADDVRGVMVFQGVSGDAPGVTVYSPEVFLGQPVLLRDGKPVSVDCGVTVKTLAKALMHSQAITMRSLSSRKPMLCTRAEFAPQLDPQLGKRILWPDDIID